MEKYFDNASVCKRCHILGMLEQQAREEHHSYHTPGHKVAGFDITELVYSDNLACPSGVILRAEQDVAKILGADASFLLTDGSTSGVLSMLYALKQKGCRKIAAPLLSHKSFFNGCALLGLTPVVFETPMDLLPMPLSVADVRDAVLEADALMITSPDYYGNVADLQGIMELCHAQGKPFVVDGAHGGHLHFHHNLYAGAYADMWVDGVHKSLPAFTQGAVVSAKHGYTEALRAAVDTFRTTSPSYPIMASVEYAVKYPQNQALEAQVNAWKEQDDCLYKNDDYTKLCVFSADGFALEKHAISQGIYPEFSQGNMVCFYLSPVQTATDVTRLMSFIKEMKACGLVVPEKMIKRIPAPAELYDIKDLGTEKIALKDAEGRICATVCGLFPPCLPLLMKGEKITAQKLQELENASNRFGVEGNRITVVKR